MARKKAKKRPSTQKKENGFWIDEELVNKEASRKSLILT